MHTATRKRGPLASLSFLLLLLAWLGAALPTVAQTERRLTGTVLDKDGKGLPGATVVVKGTTNGASTDTNGKFQLDNVAPGTVTLTVSFVGYTTKDVTVAAGQRGKPLAVNLASDSKTIDEVVVTGVFDKRERMDASIAISTLSANQIAVQVPVSAAELLKNVPGVYVNSSLGEIRNTVYSRGVSAGSVDAASGYYYVSMQEDGLPVSNLTANNYGPDYFLRADATIGRLEAVRGGSAAITGPNAPGGIFNYVSKTGGDKFGGELRTKFGLEGNAQPFYRADLNLGGKLNEKGDLTFNVGGFYRYANGARYPGYAMNRGGQGKFNIVKTYEGGSLKLYGKYLDDHNGWFEFLPSVNYSNPTLAPGVNATDSYLPNKAATFNYPLTSATDQRQFDPSNLVHSIDRAIGLDWQHTLGKGWSFQNNVKYSNKSRDWSSGAAIAPIGIDNLYLYYFIGGLGNFGTYTFKDHFSGQTLGTVTQSPNIVGGQFAGFNFTPSNTGDLPGQNIQANSVLTTFLLQINSKVQEVIDQASLTKKFGDNVTITAGSYVGVSHYYQQTGVPGIVFGTIQNQPHPVDISSVGFDGKTYQFTNPQGVAGVSALGGFTVNDFRQTQLSGFTGVTWKLAPELTFDGGLRYDHIRINGSNTPGVANPQAGTAGYGGLDGNPLTVYDNNYGLPGSTAYNLDKTIETISFSGALNYRFSPSVALYARYSDGRKAPDLDIFVSANTAFTASTLDPRAQHVQQAEAGLKLQKEKYNLFATPFYSLLSNVPTYAGGLNADNSAYNTPIIFNSIETYGIELESSYTFTDHFSVRAVATAQNAIAKNWGVWILGNPGPADDKVQNFSGNRADNVPNLMVNVTPNYTADKFFAFGNYRYMGNRAANVAQTFLLPGFSQVDLGAGYNFTKALTLQANVNNVLGGQGVMGFQAPGGYPNSLNRQGFTPDQLAANPNSVFSILTIQPRSYYLSAVYKF